MDVPPFRIRARISLKCLAVVPSSVIIVTYLEIIVSVICYQYAYGKIVCCIRGGPTDNIWIVVEIITIASPYIRRVLSVSPPKCLEKVQLNRIFCIVFTCFIIAAGRTPVLKMNAAWRVVAIGGFNIAAITEVCAVRRITGDINVMRLAVWTVSCAGL